MLSLARLPARRADSTIRPLCLLSWRTWRAGQRGGCGLAVIAAAEIFLQPDIQANEQIPAAHFLDLQFGFACPAVAPGNRYRCPGIATDNGLQRQFDRQVEMRRNQRPT